MHSYELDFRWQAYSLSLTFDELMKSVIVSALYHVVYFKQLVTKEVIIGIKYPKFAGNDCRISCYLVFSDKLLTISHCEHKTRSKKISHPLKLFNVLIFFSFV